MPKLHKIAGLERECERLHEIAIPELVAIPWFENVGQPSGLPKHAGRQEIAPAAAFTDIKTPLEGASGPGMDLTFHADHWHSSQHEALGRAVPGQKMESYFSTHGDPLLEKVSCLGALSEWWTESLNYTTRTVIYGYAMWRTFEVSENIGVRARYPDFFPRAIEIYRKGHIPVGWSLPFDGPTGRWRKGNFIYH